MAPTVWYYVRDLDEGRRFYQELLGFEESALDLEARWSELRQGEMEIGLAEGEPRDDGGVAHVEVTDLKAEADRLREAGRRGRDRPRADRRDASPRRLRPGRQPDSARPGAARLMLRDADLQDMRFLRDMLRHAYHWRLGDPDLPVFRYVQNWGRHGDAGVIAFDGPNIYGAAWYRVFPEAAPGFGFVDEETPELTIAVVPSHRGHGTGGELLEALLTRARSGRLSACQPQRRARPDGLLREARLPRASQGRRNRHDGGRPVAREAGVSLAG